MFHIINFDRFALDSNAGFLEPINFDGLNKH